MLVIWEDMTGFEGKSTTRAFPGYTHFYGQPETYRYELHLGEKKAFSRNERHIF